MLYDLTFLDEGQPWTPPSEYTRLKKYADNQKLFESRADEVYGHWVTLLSDSVGNALEQTAYVLSFHRRLSFLWGDLVAGEAPVVSATNDEGSEFVKDLADRNRIGITLQEAAIDQSRYGDALFRLSRRDDGSALIRPISPSYWFPIVEPSDIRTIRQHVLAHLFDNPQVKALYGDQAQLLRVEIHDENVVEHRIYRVVDNIIAGRIGNPAAYVAGEWQDFEEVPAGVDGPLIVHAPGVRTSERLFGLDDYTAIDSKMEYIMWLMAARQGVIHKHSDPSMAGPPGQQLTLDDGTTEVFVSGSRYFEIADPADAFIPQYITWEGQLAASFTQSERLWDDVYLTSETSAAAFGQQKEGLAESGSALKRLLMNSLKKAARMQERLDDPVKTLLSRAAALEGRNGLEARLEWQDGLPKDLEGDTLREVQLVGAHLTSVRSAMKRLFDLTDEQIDEEFDRIDEEREMATPAPLLNALDTARGGEPETNGKPEPVQPSSGTPDAP